MITSFKVFEVRFEDVLKSDNRYINSFRSENFDETEDFIKFITIRLNNKIRFELKYNHNTDHNLKERIKNRTTLKSVHEFNLLFKKSLIELFRDNYEHVKFNSSYSLYLKEYNFSVVLSINYNKNEIYIKTINIGLSPANVKDIIEIKCII